MTTSSSKRSYIEDNQCTVAVIDFKDRALGQSGRTKGISAVYDIVSVSEDETMNAFRSVVMAELRYWRNWKRLQSQMLI